MTSKTKKIIICLIVVLSLASIITVVVLKKMDDKIISPPTLAPKTTAPAIIDENLVGRWQRRVEDVDYNGAIVYRVLEMQLNSDGSSVMYHVGYEIDVDKETFIKKGTEWAVAEHTAEEIQAKLTANGCTSLAELYEQEYETYVNYNKSSIIFMGYWEAVDGVFYDWGQGSNKEEGDKNPYNIDGDILTVGSLKYTRVVYSKGE